MSHKILRRFLGYDCVCGGLIETARTAAGSSSPPYGEEIVTVTLVGRWTLYKAMM